MADKKKESKLLPPGGPRGNYQMWIILGLVAVILAVSYFNRSGDLIEIQSSTFEDMVQRRDVQKIVVIKNEDLVEVTLKAEALQNTIYRQELEKSSPFGVDPKGPHYKLRIGTIDQFVDYYKEITERISKNDRIDLKYEERSDITGMLLNWGFLFLLLFGFWMLMRRMTGGGGPGGQIFNIGKSKAALFDAESKVKITFEDVAGLEEAKEEIREIVEFLKNPSKFTKLGGKIPKGALLVGPPGTGKTLLAKAVAGEAAVPFFSLSGSDFVEMFVGVGASRIRDLFGQAKKQAPCIIFIDEIDAVGRHRGSGVGGGHDEREQTLNQLLVEMDGFGSNEGVILIAATNRADVLDKALLRPGRFDRRIIVDLPDVKGRYEILKVHARKIKLDPSVDLMAIARGTAGSSGADLMNLLNESALIASRRGRTAVTSQDASDACDKVRYGKERRSLEISAEEKRSTAIHESGHAIAALMVDHFDPVDKVTIIPRGFSLGATHFLPEKNRISWWKKELYDQVIVLLAGRAAEEVFINDISSGAQNDIERATKIARNMICEWGMCEALGNVALDDANTEAYYPGMGGGEKKYSEQTAQVIDREVKKMLDDGYKRALEIVKEHHDKIELMTDMLVEFETLDAEDVKEIVNGTWNTEKKHGKLKKANDLQKASPSEPPAPPKVRLDNNNLALGGE